MARSELVTPQGVNADVGFLSGLMWLMLLVFAGLAAAAVTQWNYDLALAALLPAVLLVGLALGRPKSCRAEFGQTALVCEESHEELPYDEICGVTVRSIPYLADESPAGGIVRILTPTGILELGGRLDLDRPELVQAVLDRIPRGGQMPEQPVLESFARAERERFGDERVWTYRAAEHCRERLLGLGIVGWGFLLLAVVWMIAAFENPVWGVAVVFALLSAGLIAVRASRGKSRQTIAGKHWRKSGLVISPTALAMIQGDLQGKARWDEIKSVKFAHHRLVIEVAGASFLIADIYDRPIQQIVELVRRYFAGGGADDSVASPLQDRV
jgi:hypothetical protein